MKYKCKDFYMLRTPLMPIEKLSEFLSISNSQNIDRFIENIKADSIFNEVLQISSQESYKALKNNKITEQLVHTLIKYYVRISTRSTPYGLNAGICFGSFDNISNIKLNKIEDYSKRVRVDMEWTSKVLTILESDPVIFNQLSVICNSSCYSNGNRIYLPFLCMNNLNEKNESIDSTSIRFTTVVDDILGYCRNHKNVYELKEYLKQKYTNVSIEKIDNIIINLVSNEFLISNLKFSISETNPLKYILHILNNINSSIKIYYDLLEIDSMIEKYSKCKIGEGLNYYNLICAKMSEISQSKNYLQVDLVISTQDNKLDSTIKNELEECVDFLTKLSVSTNNHITEYTNEFIEKYGFDSEVSILELLDENLGLGTPSGYKNSSRTITNDNRILQKVSKLKKILNNKINYNSKFDEINLNEQDLLYICENDKLDVEEFQQSFDLFLELLDNPNIDKKISIAPAMITSDAGQAFGRFLEYDNSDEISTLISQDSQEYYNDYIVSEVNEVTYSSRSANVALNKNNYKYSVSITNPSDNNKVSIPITDIFIGASKPYGKLYIKSRTLGKKLIVKRTNMLNPILLSNITRFLYDVSSDGCVSISSAIYKMKFENVIFSPRISYKSIVLLPASWTISLEDLKYYVKTKSITHKDFLDFCKIWNIPQYVFIQENDNRLFIDINNFHMREILLNTLLKNKNIVLQEVLQCLQSSLIKSNRNENYFNEIVVSFYQPSKNNNKQDGFIPKSIDTNYNVCNNKNKGIHLLPGEEDWTYIKLYGCKNREDELVGEQIRDFTTYLYNKKISVEHFFIKYYDPDFHIRLRIKTLENQMDNLYKELNDWFINLRNIGLISKVNIDTYERECDRYGGEKLINSAERFFCADSMSVETIINNINSGICTVPDISIGILSILSLMEAFNINILEQIEILDTSVKKDDYRKDFQRDRDNLIRLCSMNINNMTTAELSILDLLKQRDSSIVEYRNNIYQCSADSHSIISSLIHMFFNRFKANNIWEHKVRALTRHGLFAYYQYEKKFKKVQEVNNV